MGETLHSLEISDISSDSFTDLDNSDNDTLEEKSEAPNSPASNDGFRKRRNRRWIPRRKFRKLKRKPCQPK